MKTTVILLLSTGLIFGQTKQQAKNLFYQSENRIFLKIKKEDFNSFFIKAKCIEKNYKIKLSKMPIFQIKQTDSFLARGRFEQTLYGLGDTILSKYDDTGKKTKTCNAFTTN